MKIQLSFVILWKIPENSVQVHNTKRPLLKKIINIVKFYVTFETKIFCKFPNISNSVAVQSIKIILNLF